MSIQDTLQSMRKNLEDYTKLGKDSPSSINICVIKKVYPDTLKVDIFVPKDSSVVYSIPLLYPYSGPDSGLMAIPKEGTVAMVVRTTDSRLFILASLNSYFKTDNPTNLLIGENSINSESKAFLKQDSVGNQIISAGAASSIVLGKDDSIRKYSSATLERTAASKTLSAETTIRTVDGVKTMEYQKVYGEVKSGKIYSIDEIETVSGGLIIVDSSVRATILESIRLSMAMPASMLEDINAFRDSVLEDPYMEQSQIEETVSLIKTKLYNDYSISKQVAMVIEKGLAVNKDINYLDDLMNLSIDDVAVSSYGNNIVYRMRLLDEHTGNEAATIAMDSEGHIDIRCKSFNVVYI